MSRQTATSQLLIRHISQMGLDLMAHNTSEWSRVYIVIEKGIGAATDPYDGAVIDCSSAELSVAFEQAFMRTWSTCRQRFIKIAPHKLATATVADGGERPRTDDRLLDSSETSSDDAQDAVDVCPPLELHPPSVMLSIDDVQIGSKTVAASTINEMLRLLGLRSINQVTGVRLKNMFKAISKKLDARTLGDVQWSWSQACPLEILHNKWATEDKRVNVDAMSLFPPWHRDAVKLNKRQVAVLLAASMCDFWRHFLFRAFEVPVGPDGKPTPRPAARAGLTPKKRGAPTTKAKTVTKKVRTAASGMGKRGGDPVHDAQHDADVGGGGGGQGPPKTPLLPAARLVADLARDGGSLSVAALASDGHVEPVLTLESPVVENIRVPAAEQAALVAENAGLRLLLPTELINGCREYFIEDSGTPNPACAVSVHSLGRPSIKVVLNSLKNMTAAHTYNMRVSAANKSFAWLSLFDDEGDNDGASFPPGSGAVLSPAVTQVAAARDVKNLLARCCFTDISWRFFDEAAEVGGATVGARAYGGQSLQVADIVEAAQAAYMTNGLIDASLVELRLAVAGSKTFILLSAQSASLLRIDANGLRVPEAAAKVAASEIADQANNPDVVAMVINLCNKHWIAAAIDFVACTIFIYDSSPGPPSEEKTVACARVRLLRDVLLEQRPPVAAGNAGGVRQWKETPCSNILQRDDYNCGAFAVARVFCTALGLDLPACVDGDLLRLALVRHVVMRGMVYERSRRSCGDASLARTPGSFSLSGGSGC